MAIARVLLGAALAAGLVVSIAAMGYAFLRKRELLLVVTDAVRGVWKATAVVYISLGALLSIPNTLPNVYGFPALLILLLAWGTGVVAFQGVLVRHLRFVYGSSGPNARMLEWESRAYPVLGGVLIASALVGVAVTAIGRG